ncbi:hypothetical protein BB560_003782 [Smittium megazygosporum]|uniref:Mitochondrial carrier n=1 Tax=Smittium megazygosporum TaxID=133381 RepID=A0A2T9ZB68_9FUNG|nr:hypothetical protein BB560_003782 [Smittium megazygosporum]
MSAKAAKPRIETPFYFGGLASCSGVFFTHPLDLLKVRMQTVKGTGTSIGSVVGQIAKQQGISGFYKGLSAALLRQATYSTVRFGVYEAVREKLRRPDGTVSNASGLLAGMLGGAIGGVFGNPADVANVRMQNDGSLPADQRRNYKNIVNALTRMAREEGISSFFTGLGPNVIRGMIMTLSQVATYDIFKDKLVELGMDGDKVITHFCSSMLSAFVATTATNPIDVAKTRIMNSKTKEYKGLVDALLTMVRKEGASSLLKGWVPSFFRLGPHTVLVFIFLEQYKSLYINYKLRNMQPA